MQINITEVGKGDQPYRFNSDDPDEVAEMIEILSEYVNKGFIIHGKKKGSEEKVEIPISRNMEKQLKELEEFVITKEYVNKTLVQGIHGG